jgi:membrane-bound lytic murein transglycosylase D
LARQYGTTISNLQELNTMGRRTRLREGEYLVVPLANKYVDLDSNYEIKSSSKNKQNNRKIYYRVKRGDSLWKISQKYNVSIKTLKNWNKLKSNRIYPGKRLVLVLDRGNL